MDASQTVTIGAIVVICMLVGGAVKLNSKIKNEAIPVIVGIFGGILGIAGMYIIPDFPANNILDAIAIGIVSGLASTGAHQIKVQATK